MAHFKAPNYIRLLLWYYATEAPPENGDTYTRDMTDSMFADDLIKPTGKPGSYTTTAKGNAYVDLLCNTPFPVQVWLDPRKVSPNDV